MADSDPKRLGSARTSSDRPAFDVDDDPLVELARLVGDDGSFYPGTRKVTELRPAGRAREQQGGFSADLEAELMQELEASLQPKPAAPVQPAPPVQPVPPVQAAPVPREPEAPRAEAPKPQMPRAEMPRPREVAPPPAAAEPTPLRAVPPAPKSAEAEPQAARPMPPQPARAEFAAPERPAGQGRAEPSFEETFEQQAPRQPFAPRRPETMAPRPAGTSGPAEPAAPTPPRQESHRPSWPPAGHRAAPPVAPETRRQSPGMPGQGDGQEEAQPERTIRTRAWQPPVVAAPPVSIPEPEPEPEPEYEPEADVAPDFDSPEFDPPEQPLDAAGWREPAALDDEPGWEPEVSPGTDTRRPYGGLDDDDVLSALEAEFAEGDAAKARPGFAPRAVDLPGFNDFNADERTEWGGRRTLREDLPHTPGAGGETRIEPEDPWLERAIDPEQELPTSFGHFDDEPPRAQAHAARPAPAAAVAASAAATGTRDADAANDDFSDFVIPPPAESGSSPRPPRGAPKTARRKGGSRRGAVLLAGVVGVAALGAAVAYFVGGDSAVQSGPPPVITADAGPVKLDPPRSSEPADVADEPGSVVYDRVAGEPQETEGTLVDNREEPREVARIVLPPSSESTTQPGAGEDSAAGKSEDRLDNSEAGDDSSDQIDARRVRTFVVRPDGTIVASSEAESAAGAAEAAPAAPEPEPVVPPGAELEPNAVRTTTITDPIAEEVPVAAPAGETTELSALGEQGTGAPLPRPRPGSATAPAAPETAGEATSELTAAAPSQQPAQPAPAAPAETELAAAAPAETPPAPTQAQSQAPALADGYRVQLSSQRSEEQAQASLADLQGRFPSILGGLSGDVQRADLGDRGVYYRARVGPMATRAEAVEVCERLQAAGGSCFVTQ